MATISARKLADGTVSFTAQIRVKCDGVQVYQESQTFARKQAGWAEQEHLFVEGWRIPLTVRPGAQGQPW